MDNDRDDNGLLVLEGGSFGGGLAGTLDPVGHHVCDLLFLLLQSSVIGR